MGTKTTLAEQIYQELFHDITTQKLIFGQKLTLQDLKTRFQVSQTPVREALTRLIEDGLVNYYSNLGVAVTQFTSSDIRELYQCISEFDALAILFCKNAFTTAPLIYELENIITAGDQCLAKGDLKGWSQSSDDAHTVFYRHAQNHYLDDAAKRLRAKIQVFANMYYFDDPVHAENIHRGHTEILENIKAGDFAEAANVMRLHLHYNMVYALNAYEAAPKAKDTLK
ncbi:GntR family transcriptional regulator [Ihubacter sp. rT4E-8]|uniref:GntR family transcriptional regulator n=1 Tax=unclassified Ihubacter TaxID=2633299 RepID=UPI0013796BC6